MLHILLAVLTKHLGCERSHSRAGRAGPSLRALPSHSALQGSVWQRTLFLCEQRWSLSSLSCEPICRVFLNLSFLASILFSRFNILTEFHGMLFSPLLSKAHPSGEGTSLHDNPERTEPVSGHVNHPRGFRQTPAPSLKRPSWAG